MAATPFVKIPIFTHEGQPSEVVVETKVDTATATTKYFGTHVFAVRNRYPATRLISLASTHADGHVTYPDRTPASEWNEEVAVSRDAGRVPRSAWLAHPGECPPANGHEIRVEVVVHAAYEGEYVDTTSRAFALQFSD